MCYVLYNSFITVVDNTTVNAESLNPPVFEKSDPKFKHLFFFFSFSFFTCAFFFSFFHTFVEFQVPLTPPGPDCSHLRSNLVPLLFDFATNATFFSQVWRSTNKNARNHNHFLPIHVDRTLCRKSLHDFHFVSVCVIKFHSVNVRIQASKRIFLEHEPYTVNVYSMFIRFCYRYHFPFMGPAECARRVSVKEEKLNTHRNIVKIF